MPTHSRGEFYALVENRIYQRGQVLTWARERKYKRFKEMNIKGVVNLWGKMDPDMGEIGLDFYLHLPSDSSEESMRGENFQLAVESAASYLDHNRNSAVLILCEAGVTRSVFFAISLKALLLGITYQQAKLEFGRRTKLKEFM